MLAHPVHSSITHVHRKAGTARCLWTGERINKMWCLQIMDYYSALNRKDILTHATAQMSLDDITVSEINQTQKDKCCHDPTHMRFLEKSSSWRQKVEAGARG